MHFILFIPYYAYWHYTRGISDLLQNLKNIVRFAFGFFSIPILLRTIFAPWERMGESYKKGFDLESWMETFILNTLMRFVGFVIRFITIILGLLASAVSIILSLIIFVSWILMPFLLFFIMGLGVAKLL